MKNRFEKVYQEYSRRTEDRINKKIYEANPEKNSAISKLIDTTKANGHQVYLMTDWHLFKINKETKEFFKRPGADNIIRNIKNTIKDGDLLIFLGDICDGEYEDKATLSMILNALPGTKIMIRGNNDLFSDQWYVDNGFKYIVPKFVYEDILFSHRPQDNNYKINIHGHMHNEAGNKTYLASEISHYNNQVDAAYFGAREKPIPMDVVIKGYQHYHDKIAQFQNKTWKNDERIYIKL